MADLDVQPKGPSIWPWLIGLLVLVLIVWALVSLIGGGDEAPVATVPEVVPVAPAPAPVAPPAAEVTPPEPAEAGLDVNGILGAPTTWFGRTVEGDATVADAVTDRGVWLESGGQRIFAVLNEGAAGDVQGAEKEEPKLRAGQHIRIDRATVRDPSNLGDLEGSIDPQTRRILQGAKAFLVIDGDAIHIVDRPAGTAADTTAARTP